MPTLCGPSCMYIRYFSEEQEDKEKNKNKNKNKRNHNREMLSLSLIYKKVATIT